MDCITDLPKTSLIVAIVLQIAADRFAPDTGRPLDAPQRPSQSPQRHNLVVFVVSQDVAHAA
jgi:hypothetical protein